MAKAAWCSGCQQYVWVTPEGTCQNGHEAAFLTAYYESDPAEAPPAPPAETPAVTAWPVSDVTATAPPALTPELTQHMWQRTTAFAIDYVAAGLLGATFAFVLGAVWALVTRRQVPDSLVLLAQLGYAALAYGYFIVSEGAFSTTLGKALFGMRVRSATTGDRISWRQSLKRNVGLVADLLFFGLVGLSLANGSRWRQRAGDRWAGTVVVKSTAPYLAVDTLAEPVGAEPGTKRHLSWRRVGMAVAIIILVAMVVGAIAALPRPKSADSAGGSSSEAAVPSVDMSSITSDAVAPADSSAEESATPPAEVRTTTNPSIRSKELDAFIAEQYPDYRVLKVVSFPDQYDKGRLGMNYLLQNKTEPRFRLLVSVAMMKKSEAYEYPDTLYPWQVGRVLTTDGTFSAAATKDYPDLRKKGQISIIRALTAKLPGSDAIIEGTERNSTIDFNVEWGHGALDRAMQDENASDNPSTFMAASPPIYADNSRVDVTVVTW